MVKRILRKHGYPPDKQEKATQTVLEQANSSAATLPPDAQPASRLQTPQVRRPGSSNLNSSTLYGSIRMLTRK